MGHAPLSLCLAAYVLSTLVKSTSAPSFLLHVRLAWRILLVKIWVAGSRSFLALVRVAKKRSALWLLLRDLNTSITAALILAIFAGVTLAASTPYIAPPYTLVAIALAFVSTLAGQKRSLFSCMYAFSNLASSVSLMVSYVVVMCAPRYLRSSTTCMAVRMPFHVLPSSHFFTLLWVAKLKLLFGATIAPMSCRNS